MYGAYWPGTASSGEAVAFRSSATRTRRWIADRRPIDGNTTIALPDGAMILLTTAVEAIERKALRRAGSTRRTNSGSGLLMRQTIRKWIEQSHGSSRVVRLISYAKPYAVPTRRTT